jgi:hypothetical protein
VLRGLSLITVPELAAEALGSYLAEHMKRAFGSTEAGLTELIPSAARLALDCIGNSDALYHNVEHTMLVTLVGYDIIKGRALLMPTRASDYAHLIAACLFHDIGYVRGILQGDGPDGYVINANGEKTKLPRGSSDAALLPYHVDRSKLYVMDRIGKSKLLDAARISRAIECTRFPPQYGADDSDNEEGSLMRAADLSLVCVVPITDLLRFVEEGISRSLLGAKRTSRGRGKLIVPDPSRHFRRIICCGVQSPDKPTDQRGGCCMI